MKRLLCSLAVSLLVAPWAVATEVNVDIYNNSSSRVMVIHNGREAGMMNAGEHRGLTLPWDVTQVFEFYRYPEGNKYATYRYTFTLNNFANYQSINISNGDLP